jgi:hypothetical protein
MGLDFKEIAIGDKGYFDRFLRLDNPEISELTFTNMFMWRNYYKFRYAQVDNMLVLISVPEEGVPFSYAPFGEVNNKGFKDVVMMIKEYFKKNNWKMIFGRVPESMLSFYREAFGEQARIELDEANSDYVYSANDLISLSGKKYDGKRNHIHKFKKLYEFEFEKVNHSNIAECIRIMDEWCEERKCQHQHTSYCENKANRELLNNFDELGCKGALISVDGRYEAFTIGEMLNHNTAVIHIEKANSKVKGLYTITNQQFCENEWNSVEFINREQDLGIEGIRKAKLSYHPVKMSNKYSITIE